MTNGMMGTTAAFAIALAAGCGASSKQIQRAHGAEYKCDPMMVYQATEEAMKDQFPPLGGSDPNNGAVASEMRWHDKWGKRYQAGAATVGEGAVMVGAEAQVVNGKHGGYVVLARVHVFGQDVGSPRGVEYGSNDPRWPSWANGKLDNFYVKVYDNATKAGCTDLAGEAGN